MNLAHRIDHTLLAAEMAGRAAASPDIEGGGGFWGFAQ